MNKQNLINQFKETEFFLVKMEESFLADRNDFIYYANAFVRSARSITFVMQKIIGKDSVMKKWYEDNMPKILKTEDARFITLRNISEKVRPVDSDLESVSFTVGSNGKGVVCKPGESIEVILDSFIMKTSGRKVKSDGDFEDIIVSEPRRDFIVEEFDDKSEKTIKIEGFIDESKKYFSRLKILTDNFLETSSKGVN